MPRASVAFFALSVGLAVLGYSVENWGWPRVGFEKWGYVGFGCIVGAAIFLVFAIILFFFSKQISQVRFRRPLLTIPRVFVGLLVLAVTLALWSREPCTASPFYLEIVLITSVVCIALWSNHLRRAPIQDWRGVAKVALGSTYDLVLLFFLFILVNIPIAAFMPAYQCYTPRAKVSEVILAGSSARTMIDERADKKKSLTGTGLGIEIPTSKRVRAGYVSMDGIIVLLSDDPPAIVILMPSMNKGTIEWTCGGLPMNLMSGSCRSAMHF